jgi:flagellar operon protein
MDQRIVFSQQPIQPIQTNKAKAAQSQPKTGQASFQNILEQKMAPELRFSRHAQERLQARNISLSAEDLSKLNQAVSQAREKGARDSLILMNGNDLALVVSVKNNTVVTAVDGNSLRENVFTNIDSAVIV